ncbi:GIY-YIG nuclease family protein [Candidatus Roizmanbacteria bacterium]|nr:MAG: GIY-YIG nuclease family protein [Candidatus Roizmanbacteria bacterium]
MYTVYILQSTITGKYYIGSTNDLPRRLNEHNSNKTNSLKNKGPFIVIYTEEYPDRATAYRRELQIKSYKGGKGFKKLIDKKR